MVHCPNLGGDNQCKFATDMAGCTGQTMPVACNACQTNENRCAINVVTNGMAMVNKERRKQNVTELEALLHTDMPDKDPIPATLKMSNYRPGPGNELRKMIAWFVKPSEMCNYPVTIE